MPRIVKIKFKPVEDPFIRKIYEGLDSSEHNRLFEVNYQGKFVKVKNYGKRKKKGPCTYCKILKGAIKNVGPY